MGFLRRAWEDIRQGENLDLYVTVTAAIVLTVLNILGQALSLTAPVSLAVLALLAVAILGNRHRIEVLLQSTAKGVHGVFYADFPDDLQREIQKKIEQSTDLLLMGANLDQTLRMYYDLLERKLQRRDKIRVVLVDPDSYACEILAKRRYRPSSPESHRAQIRSSLETLEQLREKTSDKLEVRVIDYPLTHGGLVADANTPQGTLYIWNYSFKTRAEGRPKFVLRTEDGYWYEHFREEADAIWDQAVAWQGGRVQRG